MLSTRKEAILRVIIGEYLETAQPVGSEAIARKYSLGVSPATVRNEMADLEDLGYVSHPHTSAGRIPSNRGYRYFVDNLIGEPRLPLDDQYRILHQFHQVEMELEEWVRLAAALLAQTVHNLAVVTVPKSPACRLKRFQLLSIHAQRAWLVLLLHEGMLERHLLQFEAPTEQEELDVVAGRLNQMLYELTAQEILDRSIALSDLEKGIVAAMVHLMQGIDRQHYQDLSLEGLNSLLGQPEFEQPLRVRRAMEVLGERGSLLDALPPWGEDGRLRISIGEENSQEALQDLSVIASPYGIPGEVGGIVAVLGPMRMDYERAISTAAYLAAVLSELLRELHG